jgi:hypothetical protein
MLIIVWVSKSCHKIFGFLLFLLGRGVLQPGSLPPLVAPIYWPHQDLTQHRIRTSYVLQTSKARKRRVNLLDTFISLTNKELTRVL